MKLLICLIMLFASCSTPPKPVPVQNGMEYMAIERHHYLNDTAGMHADSIVMK